ncbi:MAG: hypothetical protein CMN30_09095 [Sandaracinus sp.]|nr:hypothetical protein [Sandaracinus sp.]|tara:strand:- start:4036 stop:5481 length:1446 start_codon:yes stop_codon:yes gene_type:complete
MNEIEEREALQKLSSGVDGLDELLRGGLPENRVTMVAGSSGTGKTLFALQAACHWAHAGKRVVFVSTEEAEEDLLATGELLGFRSRQARAEGSLTIVDISTPAPGSIMVTGDFDVRALEKRLEQLTEKHQADVLVLDSASALFAHIPPGPTTRRDLIRLLHALRSKPLTMLVTTETTGRAREDFGPLGFEQYVCDVVIALRNVVDGKRRRRTIEVHKYRRSDHLKGEFPAAVTDRGLSVYPLDARPRPARAKAQPERFPSGATGLDELTGGGWLRDNIVIVRGPTGSGKTTLAGMYALSGARRGERVFYYGFEETQDILVRNFEQLGLDAHQCIEEGSLKIICRYPEATSPEDLVIELRSVLEEYEPSLIVLDSISAIDHVTSFESFRQFIIGMVSALRRHGRSALLTQTVDRDEQDRAAPYLSTIADAILVLRYELEDTGLDRSMRVLKMRGSDHETRPQPFRIGPGGVIIEGDRDFEPT